jgi:hypothetical protein
MYYCSFAGLKSLCDVPYVEILYIFRDYPFISFPIHYEILFYKTVTSVTRFLTLGFFRHSITPTPQIITLKYFWILFRIRQDFRL